MSRAGAKSMLDELTPLILTYNEAPNIGRTLAQLKWARDIVVVDSFSTDETLDILRRHPQVRVFQRPFDTFAGQCNFGLTKVESEWVLSIDADYILSDELISEIDSLPPDGEVDGYAVRFRYQVWGSPLRGTLYPARQVLYRKNKAEYLDDGHAHRVKLGGVVGRLSSYIYHDDRKPLDRWTASQARYAVRESDKLLNEAPDALSLNDRVRRLKLLAPFVVLFYCLILYRAVLDGWAGWYYAFQRAFAEVLLAVCLIEREKLGGAADLTRWVSEQNELAASEAQRVLSPAGESPGRGGLRRLKFFVPVVILPYRLLVRGDFLAGWRGVRAAYRRALFELLVAIRLIEAEDLKVMQAVAGRDSGPLAANVGR